MHPSTGPRREPGDRDACGRCPRAVEDAYSERELLARYLREAGEIPY